MMYRVTVYSKKIFISHQEMAEKLVPFLDIKMDFPYDIYLRPTDEDLFFLGTLKVSTNEHLTDDMRIIEWTNMENLPSTDDKDDSPYDLARKKIAESWDYVTFVTPEEDFDKIREESK